MMIFQQRFGEGVIIHCKKERAVTKSAIGENINSPYDVGTDHILPCLTSSDGHFIGQAETYSMSASFRSERFSPVTFYPSQNEKMAVCVRLGLINPGVVVSKGGGAFVVGIKRHQRMVVFNLAR